MRCFGGSLADGLAGWLIGPGKGKGEDGKEEGRGGGGESRDRSGRERKGDRGGGREAGAEKGEKDRKPYIKHQGVSQTPDCPKAVMLFYYVKHDTMAKGP